MEQKYDVIVPMTMDNLPVFQLNIKWMKKNLSCSRILVIGASKLLEPVKVLGADFIDEDSLIEGLTLGKVKECIQMRIGEGKRAGWYFQQFLKLAYAYVCQDEYYIVWDADTIPLHPISHWADGKPVFTKKEEMEPAYFETLKVLFDGKVKRYGDFSFICENMIIHVGVMKEMLSAIMAQPKLKGSSFWEKILSAVSDEHLAQSGFSEFETYGNYVMTYHPQMYRFRMLRGMRKGAEFFGREPSQKQLAWAAKSYDTIAFERWSYHHRWVGWLCANPVIMTFFSLKVIERAKRWVSSIRG